MLNEIQFTITATLRPEVLEQTLSSFNKNIIDFSLKDYECLVNVDCIPEKHASPKSILDVCNKYFGSVVPNICKSPNFCASVKWLWTHATADYIFHLEDDWELVKSFKMCDMLSVFIKNPELYQVRLRKRTKEYGMHMYGLSPCVISRKCYAMGRGLDSKTNPEIQLNDILGLPEGKVSIYPSCVLGKFDKPPVSVVLVRDIGRIWRKKIGMSKPRKENEKNFLSWIKRKKIIR